MGRTTSSIGTGSLIQGIRLEDDLASLIFDGAAKVMTQQSRQRPDEIIDDGHKDFYVDPELSMYDSDDLFEERFL